MVNTKTVRNRRKQPKSGWATKGQILVTKREVDLCQRISGLLDRLREASNSTPVDTYIVRAIQSEIVELLDGYLRESLLPVMAKMFGPQVYRKDRDSSACFTVMIHELFIKILEGRSELTRFEDARHLRNWCSQVIRHQMLNHIGQKKQRHQNFQAIAPLYEAHRSHFEKRFGVDTYDRALVIIESWESGDDKTFQRYAAILSLHYIMGAPWDEVCETLNISRTAFYEQRKDALEALGNDL